jgi:hypothetical protein
MARRRSASVELGKSSIPEWQSLRTEHARLRERHEIVGVARDDAAPETDVDLERARRRRELLLERVHRRRHGDAVQGHVDEARHSPDRSGASRRLEAFPLGTAWLVHVYVAVDEPGQEHGVAEVVDRQVAEVAGVARGHVGDALALDDHRAVDEPFRRDDAPRDERAAGGHRCAP